MKRREPISNVMTSDPVTVDRNRPLSEVYQLLKNSSFHHLPVVEGDKPVGIISSTDILGLVYDIKGSDDRAIGAMLDYQFNVDDAMTEALQTLPANATVRDAADILAHGAIHSVVIVDDDGSLVGIVTTTDLISYLRDL